MKCFWKISVENLFPLCSEYINIVKERGVFRFITQYELCCLDIISPNVVYIRQNTDITYICIEPIMLDALLLIRSYIHFDGITCSRERIVNLNPIINVIFSGL